MLEQRFQEVMGLRESEVLQAMGQDQLANISQRVGANKKVSRDEAMTLMRDGKGMIAGKLLYADFQKIILDFQLEEHERFLRNFTDLFKSID